MANILDGTLPAVESFLQSGLDCTQRKADTKKSEVCNAEIDMSKRLNGKVCCLSILFF